MKESVRLTKLSKYTIFETHSIVCLLPTIMQLGVNWGFNEVQELCWQEITKLDKQETDKAYKWMYDNSDIRPEDKGY